MATIRDVARLAGVSTATVSRVLTGDAPVRPRTMEKVEAAIANLHYRPNSFGRALRTQRSHSLALIIADIENPFLTTVTRGVELVARAEGYSLLLFNSDEDAEREAELLVVALENMPAGVLITPTSGETNVSAFLDAGVPVVGVDRPLSDERADNVLVESRSAARRAVEFLLEHGHRRIALVTGPHGTYTAEERYLGWREGLLAAGLDPVPDLVRYGDFKVEGGEVAAISLFSQDPPPDAVVVANSLLAVGVLRVVGQRGLTIGDDEDSIGFVAFDDAPWTMLVRAPLAVVRQPALELGRTAAELLVARIRGTGPRAPQTTTLHSTPV